MPEWTFDEKELRRRLALLDHRARVAFALSCAERLLPNYHAFVREQAWGNATPLRNALDAGWTWLRGDAPSVDPAALKDACEAEAPDTEDFDSILVSPALDAANAAALVLELILTGDGEKAAEIALLDRDTVDMYVQEIIGIPPNAPDLENRIRLHPLMQAEIARQAEDLRLLEGPWNEPDVGKRWFSPATSNIGLS
jgi:uncharacterized protein YjaG (DUF416 family)